MRTSVRPRDIEKLEHPNGCQDAEYAVFSSHWCANGTLKHQTIRKMTGEQSVDCSLGKIESLMCTVSPVQRTCEDGRSFEWAPIGLRDMYNAGGAVLSATLEKNGDGVRGVAEVSASGFLSCSGCTALRRAGIPVALIDQYTCDTRFCGEDQPSLS